MIFRVRGYHKPLENPSNGALARATLDKQLRQFKRNIRQVVDKTMGGQGDAHLLKPRKGQIDALKGVGILGKHVAYHATLSQTLQNRPPYRRPWSN